MLWHRKDYLDHLCSRADVGREMFVELFGPLIGLDEEWRAQGASEDEIAMVAFEWDYVERIQPQADYGPRNGLSEKVIEETEKLRISLDRWGRRMQLPKGKATFALPETYPMTGAAGWNQVKAWLQPHPDRINWESVESAKIRQELEYKMQPCMRGGGVMFGLDHRIPPGTPLAAYREYVRLGREILGLPPTDKTRPGWARMA